jgi:hypothetical protein
MIPKKITTPACLAFSSCLCVAGQRQGKLVADFCLCLRLSFRVCAPLILEIRSKAGQTNIRTQLFTSSHRRSIPFQDGLVATRANSRRSTVMGEAGIRNIPQEHCELARDLQELNNKLCLIHDDHHAPPHTLAVDVHKIEGSTAFLPIELERFRVR